MSPRVWGAVVAVALAAGGGAAAGQAPPVRADACVACHLEQAEERLAAPARDFTTDDVHGARGFGCLACHAGAPGVAPLTAPPRSAVPALCGRCHSDPDFMRTFDPSMRVDQVAEFRTSLHGRLLERGDPDVATCVDCHPAHGIRPPEDTESSVHAANVAATCARCHADPALMAPRGRSTGQVEAWRSGVHGRAMEEEGDRSAPTCNDCHGNHGAAPPGVGSVRNVCGQCHATMQELFAGSGHADPFTAAGLPGCATCHDHHAIVTPDDDLLLDRQAEVCAACHAAGDPAAEAFGTMHALITGLGEEEEAARSVLERAEDLGMEVSQALFELEDAGTAATKARSAVHGLAVEGVRAEVEAGLDVTRRARARGGEALQEHRERRYGLAFSAGLIVLMVLGLVLKIGDMERGAATGRPSEGRHA